MRRLTLFLLLLFTVSQAFSQLENVQCYTVVAGKDVTQTGKVIAAHNEDDFGNLIVNLYKTPAGFFTGAYRNYVPDDKLFKHEPLKTLWFEVTKQKFGDALVNDHGVAVWSDACSSREDTAQGLLTYELRRLVAEYARNAREGVKILGKLVETYGYNSSGRTYCIADANEGWLVAVVQGKHWVAQRVPDSMVAIIPNYYTIEQINLDDTVNFLGSKDIVDYAIKRGWYDPQKDGEFNFRKAYAKPATLTADWNIPRQWGGMNLISADTFGMDQPLPFAFKPAKKVSVNDMMKILSYHYEGTALAPDPQKVKNPHQAKPARICNPGTKISLVAQFHSTLADDPQNIIYFAPLNPCIQPYVPLSVVIKDIPPEYQSRPLNEALAHHFDKDSNTFQANPEHAYSIFFKCNTRVNNKYWTMHPKAEKYKQSIESRTKKQFEQAQDKAAASTKSLEIMYSTKNKMLKMKAKGKKQKQGQQMK